MIWLVHFKAPVTSLYKEYVNNVITPYKLSSYIPHNSFMIVAPRHGDKYKEFINILKQVSGFISISEYKYNYKVDQRLPSPKLALKTFKNNKKYYKLEKNDKNYKYDSLFIEIEKDFNINAKELSLIWASKLIYYFGNQTIEVRPVTNERILLKYENTNMLPMIITWLSFQPEVYWINPRPKPKILNRYARYVTHGNNDIVSYFSSEHLNGLGQIVQITDTGVDYDGCFFYDPNHNVPLNSTNMNHRKIVRYWTYPSNGVGDYSGGHGTHTAGSVAGEALPNTYTSNITLVNELAKFNGMAYKAKLAVYDVGTPQGTLEFPDQITTILQDGYSHGARVSSNSWGSDDSSYDSWCLEVDKFVWNNPDFLILFAAGNDGTNGYVSVTNPGVVKNGISVGASKNAAASWGTVLGVEDETTSFQALIVKADFGGELSVNNPYTNKDMVLTPSDVEGCTQLPPNSLTGKIVLVQRGTCYFTQKARNVQTAGGIMLLLYDNTPSDYPDVPHGEDAADIHIPVAMMSNSSGQYFIERIENQDVFTIRVPITMPPQPEYSSHDMADFSSRGPTPDGRLKPDIVAPGEVILSAHSDGIQTSHNCQQLQPMSGTSMATPITAGLSTIVRQYFTDGYYPHGYKNAASSLFPSAALIKAVLLNSGEHVGGEVVTTDTSEVLQVLPPPSVFQGYGRVELASTLYLKNSSNSVDPLFKLWVKDQLIADHNTNQHATFCFKATATSNGVNISSASSVSFSPFKATLVWSDYPPSLSAYIAAVNNLDLYVARIGTNSHEVVTGNDILVEDQWDSLNNNEQVSLQHVDINDYIYVHVLSTKIVHDTQKYSLVVNGLFEEINCNDVTEPNLCPDECGGNGNCINGKCQCDLEWGGFNCEIYSELQHWQKVATNQYSSQSETFTLASRTWKYFRIVVPNDSTLLQIKFHRMSSQGDPDLYVNRVGYGFPNQYNHTWQDRSDDSHTPTNLKIYNPVADTYIVGVEAYCCVSTKLYVEFDLTSSSSPSEPTASPTPHPTPAPTTPHPTPAPTTPAPTSSPTPQPTPSPTVYTESKTSAFSAKSGHALVALVIVFIVIVLGCGLWTFRLSGRVRRLEDQLRLFGSVGSDDIALDVPEMDDDNERNRMLTSVN